MVLHLLGVGLDGDGAVLHLDELPAATADDLVDGDAALQLEDLHDLQNREHLVQL